MASNNDEKFQDVHHQLTNKAAWFWNYIAENVLHYQVAWYSYDGKQPAQGRRTVSLATVIGWLDTGISRILNGVADVSAKLDGLTAAVRTLGERQGVDPAALAKIINDAVERAADKHLADIGTYELRRVETPAAEPAPEGTNQP